MAVWVYLSPIEVRDMEGDHNGACDQKTHEVSDHQATQEDKEEGSWSAMCPPERLYENYEGDEVGGKTQKAENGWEVGWGDGRGVREWRAVDGVAEWGGVVGEWRDRGIHDGQLVWGSWFQMTQRWKDNTSVRNFISLFNLNPQPLQSFQGPN